MAKWEGRGMGGQGREEKAIVRSRVCYQGVGARLWRSDLMGPLSAVQRPPTISVKDRAWDA